VPNIDQDIRFSTASDGARIAYATAGEGPPLVFPPGWVSHLELDWAGVLSPFYARFAQSHRVIRYDKRGTGLSDRTGVEFTIDALVTELEELVDDIGLDRFALIGMSQGGPTVLAYAARHPDRVSRLVMYAAYASGPNVFFKPEVQESMLSVVSAHWGIGAKVLTDMLMPGASSEQAAAFASHQKESASAEVAAGFLKLVYEADVTDALASITAPTLVVHRRGDRAVPFTGGREIAAGIPRARFVPLEGVGHVPVNEEQLDELARPIEAFLSEAVADDEAPPLAAPGGFQTILFTDLESSTALTQRLGDEGAQALLRGHNEAVRAALDEHGGREVKHTGDGIMASFPSAVAAVTAALAMQRELAGGEVRVRIGLNAGEPIAEDDDLFGTAVQLAARVTDRAEPGQVLVSNVVRELCAGKTFEFTSVGDATLKGFDEPVALYEVRA